VLTPAIECRDVWKIFGERAGEALAAIERDGLTRSDAQQRFDCVIAVAGVSFAVGHGEIFCVMGLSGSGKSTLVRHINRLIEPTAGHILVAGEDISAKSTMELRRLRSEKIGMVFQHVALFPHRTVRDNVAFGLEVRGRSKTNRWEIAQAKLDLVQLGSWGDRYPHELSGGMQQRVGLARALAADPEILLMDEPFSALDPVIRRELQEEFARLASVMRKTTLFITHDLDEAIFLGDRIAVMKDGRFSQIGTPEEIVMSPADDYVANFVRGVSRLKLLKAASLIDTTVPIERADATNWPQVAETATMSELIAIAVGTEAPIIVVASNGRPTGAVTRRSLLLALQAGPDVPAEDSGSASG
jgi:glycine betaine/proline transport system ATP-binding protein